MPKEAFPAQAGGICFAPDRPEDFWLNPGEVVGPVYALLVSSPDLERLREYELRLMAMNGHEAH